MAEVGVIRRRSKAIRPAARTWRPAPEGRERSVPARERGPPWSWGCTSAAKADAAPRTERGKIMLEECGPERGGPDLQRGPGAHLVELQRWRAIRRSRLRPALVR